MPIVPLANIQHSKPLNAKKTVITVIVLNIIQITIVFGFILYEVIYNKGFKFTSNFKDLNLLLGIVLGIIFVNGFMMLRDAHILNQVQSQAEMVKESLDQVAELNTTLRSQRHDFMNHLQVIYSLMELKEYQEGQNYLDRVYADIQKISRVLKTANPAINALLQAKVLDCEKRGIQTQLHITSRLSHFPVSAWEMCRILGNLIDNAVDALQEINGERILRIEIYEDLKCYGFRVKNNGPVIPANLREKIFEANFTTKGQHGQGLGLAIVKELVHSNHGELRLASDETVTTFEVVFAKQIM